MPYRRTPFVVGEYYHIFNRGALRNTLFYNHSAYVAFVGLIRRFAADHGIKVILICLMPNHFHLLVQIMDGGDLSEFMRVVCNSFSKRSNRELRRTGTVFEGRFKDKHVNSTSYLEQVCLYIHANPVKAGLVNHPADWQYSNYLELIGERRELPFDPNFFRRYFRSAPEYEAAVLTSSGQTKIASAEFASHLAEMMLL